MEKKEQAMEGKILVLLRRHNRIEDILPSLEKIAQPGMKVVFLIPYPAKLWPWLRDHWVTTESSREAIVLGKKISFGAFKRRVFRPMLLVYPGQ
jgi:hypothetical protein